LNAKDLRAQCKLIRDRHAGLGNHRRANGLSPLLWSAARHLQSCAISRKFFLYRSATTEGLQSTRCMRDFMRQDQA
jgi:hypothetical protein